jgi:hypothetical protein
MRSSHAGSSFAPARRPEATTVTDLAAGSVASQKRTDSSVFCAAGKKPPSSRPADCRSRRRGVAPRRRVPELDGQSRRRRIRHDRFARSPQSQMPVRACLAPLLLTLCDALVRPPVGGRLVDLMTVVEPAEPVDREQMRAVAQVQRWHDFKAHAGAHLLINGVLGRLAAAVSGSRARALDDRVVATSAHSGGRGRRGDSRAARRTPPAPRRTRHRVRS